ncbi:MAG TPA: DUF1778 domain-containing protein [Urbifossiella sp.]|jgi:hypothetical protein|nr:DUF1778 domain-containing protein [Urbifossiella sp.]
MTNTNPEIRVTDGKARLTLPRAFANSTLLLEIRNENEIVIRKAKVVPLAEEAPETIVLSDRDWEHFMAALEHPAEPNEPLKKLMKEFGPWKGASRSKK